MQIKKKMFFEWILICFSEKWNEFTVWTLNCIEKLFENIYKLIQL